MDLSIRKYKRLNTNLLQYILGESIFKGGLVYREHLDSTNKYAKELCEKGAREGTIVVAEYQSAGKGRMRRKWLAKPRANLLFSVVLRPKDTVEALFLLNCAGSVALVKGLEQECKLEAGIKWPNDIYVGGRKLGGLLGEFSIRSGMLDYVVIGIGLNVNWAPEQMGPGSERATSVWAETGKRICRTRLLGNILIHVQDCYHMLGSGNKDTLLQIYKHYSIILGRKVKIVDEDEIIHAKAIDIMQDGTLMVASDDGTSKYLKWGDVSLRL